ncbi:uracil-DNA glycosylase family protein [Haloarchaeobius sp. HME9146]|uniref:uracil-DNA glycosylase n=1 Tax=Haloarchaeobius sp. HME9146 TaxID=2978732 RepID=UPI0021C17475|nr:uracil-DNA glycosylase [Haloarchaeobius sp. HME9146]MCT9094524.1 uracil-DNA glycosylase [Haloarchaeobius sp. HME9146]
MANTDSLENMDGLEVTACERCPELCESRSRIVNGVGPDDAAVLFLGEAPGAQEDEEGEPFVGRSGDVLTEELRNVGLDRETVRITNCVRCRPPDNRNPRKEELANCREYLEREIDLVDPEVIVTLGKVPAEHLLDRSVAVTKETGNVEEVRIAGEPRRVMLCLHPAATLYDRSQREPFEETLAEAASLAGVRGDGGESGQSRLGDF